uniref:Peptidase A1 domain-containing protein n=1 Tax=Oryza punctata TaxID=4537 RepID=A0A0E0JTE4_ORYPU
MNNGEDHRFAKAKGKPLHLVVISLLAVLPWYTLANDGGGKPLVTAVTKDDSTKLYTIAVKDGHPLALDLSGPLVWSTCDASHSTVMPYERECMEANRCTLPSCWMQYGSGGGGGAGSDYRYGNKCTAHPYNSLTGRCAPGDLTRTTLAADATNGSNPLYPVSFPADGAAWYIFGGNSLVQVDDTTACFAFVEMTPEKVGSGYGGSAPAVVIGGYQMEHNLVVFDEEKQQLGFSGLLFGLQTTCNNFNFTPILVRITKDTSTSLYTMSIKTGSHLVLDLGGPLLWSTCLAAHTTVPCRSDVCAAAAVQENRWNCSSSTGGGGGRSLCTCSAYPYNPLSGQCARGDVTTTPVLANVTDGVNPLYPVAFPVHAACAPDSLVGSLPSGAVGVAGLSGAPLSLPSQVAASLKVEKKFALCLPGGGTGAAIFGGGPFHLMSVPDFGMLTDRLGYYNLTTNPKNGRFYLDVVGIAVNHRGADIPPDSLALDAGTGRGGVMLSTVTPYTALRPDIYRAVIEAIDVELSLLARAPSSWPFERCYQRSALWWTRVGPPLATVDLMLRSGGNWTFFGSNMIVQVNEETLCFAIVEMGPTPAMDESPAVIIGGFQLEDNLLVFDLEKGRLGSTGLLYWIRTTCSNFNFTWGTPERVLPWLALSLLLASLSPPNAMAATGRHPPPSKPIVTRLGKDAATSLYTVSVSGGGAPLVVDLAGSLLWSTCPAAHRTIPCSSSVCKVANRNHPASCPYSDGGRPGSGDRTCACAAYPYNPVSGQCGRGDVTAVRLAANATDGKNPLFPVSFSAFASCAPGGLLTSFPLGVAGVAGMSRMPLSLPSQVASSLKVERQFALCLPASGGGDGAAIFGGGPFQLLAAPPVEIAEGLRRNPVPLLKNPKNGAYYLRVTGIAVNLEAVPIPSRALDLDVRRGTGGVMLSTVTPYTTLRPDVYRAVLRAFDAATSGIQRAAAVKPFEMCYQASALGTTRLGFAVANIDLMLGGGRNWTLPGGSSLVQVNEQTVCYAFLEMGTSPAVADSPAIVIGGFQMENNLLLFDLEKWTLGISSLLSGLRTGCGAFNFTMGSS